MLGLELRLELGLELGLELRLELRVQAKKLLLRLWLAEQLERLARPGQVVLRVPLEGEQASPVRPGQPEQ